MIKEAPLMIKYVELGIFFSVFIYMTMVLSMKEVSWDFSETVFMTENNFLLSVTFISFILWYPFFLLLNLIMSLTISMTIMAIDMMSSAMWVWFVSSMWSFVETAFNLMLDFMIQLNNWFMNIMYFPFSMIIDKISSYFVISPIAVKLAMGTSGLFFMFFLWDSFIDYFNLKSLDDFSILMDSFFLKMTSFLNWI